MSKIVVTEFVSLDGVFEDPHLWHFPFFNDAAGQYKGDELKDTAALLLGRKTYEGFADAWPKMSGDEFSDTFNSMPKHVVSTTLENAQWNNSHIISSDVAAALADLKNQYDQDIYIHGSGDLANSLIQLGLIDEIRLMVHPIVVGKGRRFFNDGTTIDALKIIDVTTFDAGVVLLTLQPTSQEPTPKTGE
jgi:dihydrofolate reductase